MHAFISHSSTDAEFAARLVQILEAEGISCWIAPRDIPIGANYAAEILSAIESCSCIAVIFTDAANDSPHVLREVERAVSKRRNIVPLKASQIQPSGSFGYFLATIHTPSVPDVNDSGALRAYAEAITSCLTRCESQQGGDRVTPTHSRDDALELLWQMTTELELRYRKYSRERASEEEWVGMEAVHIALNEFVILNRRYLSSDLQTAAQDYTQAISRLALAIQSCKGSAPAVAYDSTRRLGAGILQQGTELSEANKNFEHCRKIFEAEHKLNCKPSFIQRLFGWIK